MLTRSRSAIFLLDLMVLWRIYKTEKLTKKLKWYLLWGVFNLAAVIYISQSPTMMAFFSGIKGIGSLNDFSTNRVDLLEYGYEEFRKSPLLGRGVYYDRNVFVGSTGIHNILLEILAESGVIGFALYVASLIIVIKKSNLRKIVKKDRSQLIVFGILLSFFINSFVEVVYFNYIYDSLFWSFAAVMVSNASHQRADEADSYRQAFADPSAVIEFDELHSAHEDRYDLIGAVGF